MTKLNITKNAFVSAIEAAAQGDPSKLDSVYQAILGLAGGYDYNSGWASVPTDNIVDHDLSAVPKEIHVYEADEIDGTGMTPATFSVADNKSVTVTVTKDFVLVLANR